MKKTPRRSNSRAPKKVQTKTRTITNTQLLLASVAALLANGLALAAVPVKMPKPAVQKLSCTPTITSSERSCRLRGGAEGFRNFVFTCPNGRSFRVNTSCRTAESTKVLATKTCSQKRYCVAANSTTSAVESTAPRSETQPSSRAYNPEVAQDFSDLAFVGRPEANFILDIKSKEKPTLTIHYTNRGPAALPGTESVQGGTRVVVSLLDEKQDPLLFEPESFLPPAGSGQSVDLVLQLSESAAELFATENVKFIKAELKVGERVVGGTGAFDPDITNNSQIVDISVLDANTK